MEVFQGDLELIMEGHLEFHFDKRGLRARVDFSSFGCLIIDAGSTYLDRGKRKLRGFMFKMTD